MTPYRRALIVGAGPGLGASLARAFAGECGMRVVVAARRREPLEVVAADTGATPLVADASNGAAVDALFDAAALALGGAPDVVVYNASQRVRGSFIEVDAEAVARAVDVTAIAAFRVAQQAVCHMLPYRHGAGLFTGASAGTNGVRTIGRVRAGQVCVAWPRAEQGAGAGATGHPCRSCRRRRRNPSRRRAEQRPRRAPRPRRHCCHRRTPACATAQRLAMGDRGASLGRALLI